jgi:hypothetical protein
VVLILPHRYQRIFGIDNCGRVEDAELERH